VLSKITYPTGGYSSFLFEKNDYSMYYLVHATVLGFDGKITTQPSNASQNMIDGFRIKKKVSKSSDTD